MTNKNYGFHDNTTTPSLFGNKMLLFFLLLTQARREKISERMKFLQDLIPGCNKVSTNDLFLSCSCT